MNLRHLDISTITLTITIATTAAAAGCSDDTEPERICKYVHDPSECRDWSTGGPVDEAEAGAFESGDPEADPDADPDNHPLAACVLMADGIPRTVIQCNGSLTASIAFETLLGNCANTLGDPGFCDESYDFGLGFEPYEMPEVMACCDPEAAAEAELLEYCAADMIEQICRSAPKRLELLIDEGAIKVGKHQARALRDWLNAHQQDCFDVFNVPAKTPGAIDGRAWLVNGGNNEQWPALKNFTIRLETAAVHSTTVPDDAGERVACDDAEFNNTEFFEDFGPITPGIGEVARLDEDAEATIRGPKLLGNAVTGVARLPAQAGCMAPRCSTLALRVDGSAGSLALEELSLFAAGEVTLVSGALEVAVEGAALRLYGVAQGTIHAPAGAEVRYELPVGAAHFMVSGASPRLRDARMATNTTAIIIRRRPRGGWSVDGFAVTHVDGAGDRWTVWLPETRWD